MHEFVNKAVGSAFKPVELSRVLRGQVWRLMGTGLLIALAFTPMPFFIKVQLVVWIAYRISALFTVLWVGTEIVNERERRLAELPAGWRDFLIAGRHVGGVVDPRTVAGQTELSPDGAAFLRSAMRGSGSMR